MPENNEEPLSLAQEEDIRDRARHCINISNDQLWALLDELDRTRLERGQQRAAKNSLLRNINHPDVGSLILDSLKRLGGQADESTLHGEKHLLRQKIGDYLRAQAERAERRQT